MDPYYHDGSVTLYHGCALTVLSRLANAGVRVAHCITDPPYMARVFQRDNGSATLTRQVRGMGSGDRLPAPVSRQLARIVDRWSLVFTDAEHPHRWRTAFNRAGINYIRTGVWLKPNSMPQLTGDRPSQAHECIVIGHSPDTRLRWNGGGKRALWVHGVERKKRGHPTPKPEGLISTLVGQFTDVGELVLDPFAGSGTLGRVCKDMGRRAILIERSEHYCEVIAQRLRQESLFSEPAAPAQQIDLFTGN